MSDQSERGDLESVEYRKWFTFVPMASLPGALFLGIMLLAGAGGCAREASPGAGLKPVTSFSLGSAKAASFRSRPTADELYKAALRLVDSFRSAAATTQVTSRQVNAWTEADGKAEDIKETEFRGTQDYRWVKPDKELIAGHSKDMWVTVRNGKTGFTYVPSENRYLPHTPPRELHTPPARWIGLSQNEPFTSKRLLPDRRLKSTEVFVLELRTASRRDWRGLCPAAVTRIYLGKKDLLPRRIESVVLREGAKARVRGLPDDVHVEDFLGFVANAKIPSDVFPVQPSKGASASRKITLH